MVWCSLAIHTEGDVFCWFIGQAFEEIEEEDLRRCEMRWLKPISGY